MILARAIGAVSPVELESSLHRLGLPPSAREYLTDKMPAAAVLLTGLTRTEGRFLKAQRDQDEAPGREDVPFFVSGDQAKRPGTALLSGRREQFDRLLSAARAAPELGEFALALSACLASVFDPPRVWRVGDRSFPLGERTYAMGVVNVTPDSFSDGGRFFDPGAAIAHGLALVEAGADLLDVGGESTRPGAEAVSEEEERRRVVPVIEGLRAKTSAPISIDTTKAAVAEAALAAGATLVNDISGLGFDALLAEVTGRAAASLCVMHIQGTPRTMQADPRYGDVVEEVIAFLRRSIDSALTAGVSRDRIVADPGIGFGKTVGHNLFLLRHLAELRVLGVPLLVGTSRKAFLGKLTGGKPADERLWATVGSVAAMAALGGADIVRIHDVAECRDALAVADAIRSAREGGDLFLPGGQATSSVK